MAEKGKGSRTWGGRFTKATAAEAQAFTASIGFDIRLWPYEIRASIAHARMLAACGIITRKDGARIVSGLRTVGRELDSGRFRPTLGDEDIHMAVERRLVEKIGPVGAKLHAARSRNDQVATDVRLYVKDAIDRISSAVADLQAALVETASDHQDAILPGYTHMQRAQPILLGHHLLAYHDMFERDRERVADCRRRNDVLPLGAGALAGTTLPIDRRMVAKELGFADVAANSIDAVSDRDFVIELLASVAILFSHLSRLASDVTLWASSEFGFVVLDDAYSTGSSMMPQKRNPDIAELIRGKSGRVTGDLVAVLMVLKGLPLAYNSDLQEDKEALFDSVDTALGALPAMAGLLRSLTFDETRMASAADDGFLLATDIAEYLVARGLPFRQAHEVTGRIVRWCLDHGRDPTSLSLAELRAFSNRFEAGILPLLTTKQAVARRRAPGGTSPVNLRRRLRRLGR